MRTVIRLAGLLLRLVRGAVAVAIVLFFAWMVLAVLAQVVGRYVFDFPIAGAEETATMAQIWMVLLGAGYAMRKGLHVGVDVLVAWLPPPAVRVLNAAVTALALWFLWVVFDGSFRLLAIGRFQTSPALQIPMAWAYLVLPLGAAYFALELAVAMVPRIVAGESAGAARREGDAP